MPDDMSTAGPNGHGRENAGVQPLLWIALGRQRVGKTVVLSAAAQFFRARGAAVEVWNADQQNRSHSLSRFFPDARSPMGEGGIVDSRNWIMEQVDSLAAGDGDRSVAAMLDIGGGFTAFSTLVDRVPLGEVLSAAGVRPVALFVVGPERADLDYLEHFALEGRFLPKATAIVMNEGLVEEGRSATRAFEAALTHSAVNTAILHGAKVVRFPVLSCISQLADQGLTYEAVLRGEYGLHQRRLGLLTTAEVRRFWSRDLPRFFGQFPPEWLPCPIGTSMEEAAPRGAGVA